MTHVDLEALFEQADSLPQGPEQVAFLEDVVRQADVTRDENAQYQARTALIDALYHVDGADRLMTHFAWCTRYVDAHRDELDDWELHNFMWHYKWVLHAARQFPQVPLPRMRELYADFARRLRAEGTGRRTLPYFELHLAQHLGHREAARQAFSLWQFAPRDLLSDCKACEAQSMVEYHLFQGDDARAVDCAAPILSGKEECSHVPHVTHAALLAPLVRLGRWDEADRQHLLGKKLVRGDRGLISSQAEHLWYLGVTGQFAAAAEWYTEHVGAALASHEPDTRMNFHAGASIYLHCLARSGATELPFASPRAGADTPQALADWHEQEARQLAAQFDARAGSAFQVGALEERLALSRSYGQRPHA